MTEIRVDGPVDRYLDTLFDKLSGTGGAGRRALAEAEDHLRAAVAASPLPGDEAENAAVQQFGASDRIARELRVTHQGLAAVLRPMFSGAWLLGAIGLLAMGVSGLLAEVFGRVGSAAFVAGDAAGVTYTPDRCADYFEYFPNAKSCGEAAALHHWGEVVDGRVAAGVLGLLTLLAYVVARRTLMRGAAWQPSWRGVTVVALAMFGAVAVVFLGIGVMENAFGLTDGTGVELADGSVALLAAVLVGVYGIRRMRRFA
jgi:hypothetical protein